MWDLPDEMATSQSILCAHGSRDTQRNPWGKLGVLQGSLHGNSSTERLYSRRFFCEGPRFLEPFPLDLAGELTWR